MGVQSLHLLLQLGKLLGLAVQFSDQHLRVGALDVPWSDDCAGVSFFAILPLLACWRSWREDSPASLWHLLIFPWLLAAAANALRVSGILGCRWWLQPEVESLQMHHFLGFVSLLVAVAVILPSTQTHSLKVQALHLAGVLALLTPQIQAPGGWLIAVCSVVVLATRMRESAHPRWSFSKVVFVSFWGLAAIWIGFSQMESLWLPWLLISPFFNQTPVSLLGWFLLPGCLPLVAVQQSWSWMLFLPISIIILSSMARKKKERQVASLVASSTWSQSWALLVVLVPFAAMGLGKQSALKQEVPVTSLRPQRTAPAQYELHLENQPGEIRVDWIGPQGGGRHHTLPVCMAFRGEHLHTVDAAPAVWTDGKVWRKEYFLHEGQILPRYSAYLKSSFWPGSSSGVHLIFSALCQTINAGEFAERSDALAKRIYEHQCETDPWRPVAMIDK